MRGLYVNGLNTAKSEAIEQSRILSSRLNGQVVLEYNPESNILFDLAEAVWGRWIGRYLPTKFVRTLKHSIVQLLLISRRPAVLIIAHSQGCLHVMNAVNKLTPKQKARIYRVLFASPTIYETKGLFKVEYLYNDKDWVVSDLVRHWQKDDRKVFVRHSDEHSFIQGYLDRISEYKRAIDYKTSLFAHLVKVGTSDNEEAS